MLPKGYATNMLTSTTAGAAERRPQSHCGLWDLLGPLGA
jgi:hypothetical protein